MACEVFSDFVGADAVVDGDGGREESKSCERGSCEDPGVGEVAGRVSGEPKDRDTDQAEENCRGNPQKHGRAHHVPCNYSVSVSNSGETPIKSVR